MKFLKHLLFLLLVCCVTSSHATTSESWTDPETGMSWWYTVEGDAATLGWETWKAPAVSKTTEGVLVVPSYLNGYLVVGVGRDAFYGCSELTAVALPESVSFIGERAFEGCSKLAEISVSQLDWIGSEAFDGTALISDHLDGLIVIGSVLYKIKGSCPESVIIPKGVTRIESEVFKGRANLETILLPEGLRSIGRESFYQCENLQRISFPSNVDVIALDAFRDCSNLSCVQFLGRIGSIEARAFLNCPKINSVVLPEGLQSLGYSCFSGTGLRFVSLPSTLRHDYDNVWPFGGCCCVTNVVTAAPVALRKLFNDATTNIVEVTIPDGVNEICNECLMNCSGMQNFKIPSSATNIGYAAFRNCYSLEAIDIHSGVASIGEWAFANCHSLRKILIPQTTVSIGMDTFECCTNLEEAIVDATVEGVPAHMFSMCENLSNVSISASVCYLGAEAFSSCKSLREFVIPERVTFFNPRVFYGCSGLERIYMNGDSPGYVIGESDAPFIGVNAKVYVWPWRQYWNVGGKYCGLDVVSRVPVTWADSYPLFKQKYGDDPIAALKLLSGKKSLSGEDMYVWQDYVAGTDPTDIESKFTVLLKIEDNRPVIDWVPKLMGEELCKRRYRMWGKECLNDSMWKEIQIGQEDGYYYFKGTVEMK